MVRPEGGFEYYYVIIYMGDVMVIHNEAESVIWRLDKYFQLEPSSIGEPAIYLEAKLKNMQFEKGVWAWANSPSRYIKELVANVENYLEELADAHWQFPKKKA